MSADMGRSVTNASSAFIKGGSFSQQPEKILHHNSTNEWLSAAHRASVSSGDLPGTGGHMTLYVIRGDGVTAHSSAPAIISQGELVVQSIGHIEASGLSKVELTAICALACFSADHSARRLGNPPRRSADQMRFQSTIGSRTN
jgi:hypothetical protein